MKLLLVSFLVLVLAVLGMSLGVIAGRKPIQGSCGGVGGRCGVCSGRCRKTGDAQRPDG